MVGCLESKWKDLSSSCLEGFASKDERLHMAVIGASGIPDRCKGQHCQARCDILPPVCLHHNAYVPGCMHTAARCRTTADGIPARETLLSFSTRKERPNHFGGCRRRHADMVEWAWFINSYGDDGVYAQLMNGDKDSFLLAFALANKTSEYYQVCPCPTALLSLAPAKMQECRVSDKSHHSASLPADSVQLRQWQGAVSGLVQFRQEGLSLKQ